MMRRLAVAVLTLATAAPLAAQQVTITFSEYANAETREIPAAIGEPLTSGGFDFYSTEFFWPNARNVLGAWGTSPSDPGFTNRPTNLGGSTALAGTLSGSTGSVDIFVAGDNPLAPVKTFNISSIDVAHLYSTAYTTVLQNFTLTFFGANAVGSTIQQSFGITVPPAGAGGIVRPMLTTLTFDDRWRGMENVWWSQGGFLSQMHQFTNIRAEVVPEPGTYVLLATGLAGLGLVARRRRSR